MLSYTKSGVRMNGDKMEGYAVVFYDPSNPDTEFDMGNGRVERVDPDCEITWDNTLTCCSNHVEGIAGHLGSLRADSLQLTRDRKGMAYSATVPDTTVGRDSKVLAGGNGKPSEFQGSSFKFNPNLSKYKITREAGKVVCTFTKLHLEHVSPVFDPAYKAATRSVRSADNDAFNDGIEAFLETERLLEIADSYTK